MSPRIDCGAKTNSPAPDAEFRCLVAASESRRAIPCRGACRRAGRPSERQHGRRRAGRPGFPAGEEDLDEPGYADYRRSVRAGSSHGANCSTASNGPGSSIRSSRSVSGWVDSAPALSPRDPVTRGSSPPDTAIRNGGCDRAGLGESSGLGLFDSDDVPWNRIENRPVGSRLPGAARDDLG
jgi:hypothetical protein